MDDRPRKIVVNASPGGLTIGMAEFSSTGITYLVRRVDSGMYYWQAKIGGTSRRGSLRTKSKSVAKSRLPVELSKARAQHDKKLTQAKEGVDLVTAEDWINEWLRKTKANPRLKSSTKNQAENTALILGRFEWSKVDLSKLSERKLEDWWEEYGKQSPTHSNRGLSAVKSALQMAVDAGVISKSPAEGLARIRNKETTLKLPSGNDFLKVVADIRNGKHPHSKESADMIEFLALSGLRIGELRPMVGADIGSDVLHVRGGEEGTKTRKERLVPIIPQLEELISKMGARDRVGPLFHINSPHQALKRACARCGIVKLTPHKLRHLFATTCVEAGVDMPTLAKWLGHKDGGALAMKTYSHLRDRHSISQAARVRFQ